MLRPCPLCRAERLVRSGAQARCGGCGCRLEFDSDGKRARVAYLPRRFSHLQAAFGDRWFTRTAMIAVVDGNRDAAPETDAASNSVTEEETPRARASDAGETDDRAARRSVGAPTFPLLLVTALLVVACLCISVMAVGGIGVYVASTWGATEEPAPAVASVGEPQQVTPPPSEFAPQPAPGDAAPPDPGAPPAAPAGEPTASTPPDVPAAPIEQPPADAAPQPTSPADPAASIDARPPRPSLPTPQPIPALESPLPEPPAPPPAEPSPVPQEERPQPELPPTFTPPPVVEPSATPAPADIPPTNTPPPTNMPPPPTNTPGPAPTMTPTYAPGNTKSGNIEVVVLYADDQVRLTNIGPQAEPLTGLRLRALIPGRPANEPPLFFDFPNGAVLFINGTCTVYTTGYRPTDQCPFDWGSSAGILWPDTPGKGVTVLLLDAEGRELARFTY